MVTDDDATPAASEPTARQAFGLTAEWALWGKEGNESDYRVLACSAGTLTPFDFAYFVRRYAPGTADRLPQYTVGWIPAEDGAPEFVVVAIHEHAPYRPARPGSRSRYDALGHEIVFIRLFCGRYADLAEHGVSYAELLNAVQHHELPPQTVQEGEPGPPAATAPVSIHIPAEPPRPVASPPEGLAEAVAMLLLTTAQVCVLGADEVPAADRLAFIDHVLSLLPYGLRATLSASTWASSTAQDLKLRLFFASALRDDGSRTRHVRWGQPDPTGFPEPDNEAARLYLGWLRRTGPRAKSVLAGQTAPRRFVDADIRPMVAALPRDLTVADTLEDLAASLTEGDRPAVGAEVRRLGHYLTSPLDPADRDRYRRQVVKQGLLKDHRRLDRSTRASVYRVLLSLAFETPLSYASYCEIEDAIGGPPRGPLRSVLLKLEFATFLPWLLAAKAGPEFTDEALMGALAEQGMSAVAVLTALQRNAENIRPAHQVVLYDFGVQYLRAHAEDARTELVRRGYLAETLEVVFPGDGQAQRARLQDTLRFVHGGPLTRGQIRELFADPKLCPTAAFEDAVTRLASSPKVGPFVAEQAAYARLRYAGDGEEPQAARGSRRWRWLIRDDHAAFRGPPRA